MEHNINILHVVEVVFILIVDIKGKNLFGKRVENWAIVLEDWRYLSNLITTMKINIIILSRFGVVLKYNLTFEVKTESQKAVMASRK